MPVSTPIIRTDFSGGINYKDGAEKLAPNEYPLLVNGRVRDGNIIPLKKPRLLTGINAELFQGSYGVANYLIVAADGFIYWRDFSVSDSAFALFTHESGSGEVLRMDPVRDVHFQAVASSSLNLRRSLSASSASSPLNYGAIINGSPACVVVQDGVSQPVILNPNGTWRRTQTYAEWSPESAEYVPVGTFMYYDGVILYTVSPDGRLLYRSVSGKPLDHVIVVDQSGNKGANADESAFRFTYGQISCVAPLFSEESFFTSTRVEGFRLILDFDNKFFGEPFFSRTSLASGCIAQYAFTTNNGDSVFVAQNGIVSFNAVESTHTKASSGPYSIKIQKLFQNIAQETPCAITLNDYSYFFVQTVFGPAIVVNDAHLGVFVSLDIDPRLSDVKRFSIVDTLTDQKLIVCTSTGIYCYNDSDETAEAGFYWGDMSAGNLKDQVATMKVRALFARVFEPGTITIDDYVDGKLIRSYETQLNADTVTIPPTPWTPPTAISTSQIYRTQVVTYDGTPTSGNKLGFWIRWAFAAELSALQADINVFTDNVPPNQQS